MVKQLRTTGLITMSSQVRGGESIPGRNGRKEQRGESEDLHVDDRFADWRGKIDDRE